MVPAFPRCRHPSAIRRRKAAISNSHGPERAGGGPAQQWPGPDDVCRAPELWAQWQPCAAAEEETMAEILDRITIGAAFAASVAQHADRPFLAVPANAGRGYLASGFEISYAAASKRVEHLAAIYRQAGDGVGHRVATLLENRPEYLLSQAGTQHDRRVLRADQSRLSRSRDCLSRRSQRARADRRHRRATGVDQRGPRAKHARPARGRRGADGGSLEKALRPARDADPSPRRRPASCIPPARPAGPRAASFPTAMRSRPAAGTLPSAAWPACARRKTASTIRCRSIMRTAGVVSLMGAIVTGNCQIQPDRFPSAALVA